MKEIIVDGITYVPKLDLAKSIEGLQPVLIRSYAAGVHFGLLEKEEDTLSGKVVFLRNARRVHYWEGAASLSQMAVDGVSKPDDCRIAMELERHTIVNVIEVIPLTEKAFSNLKNVPIWKV